MTIAPSKLDELVAAAAEARARAYAPYSGFAVGAATLDAEGRIAAGCNVENASYGLTMCAERTAISGAIAKGHSAPVAVAVVVGGATSAPPCGACRQVMVELCRDDAIVVLAPTDGERRILRLRELLPAPFGASNLDPAGSPPNAGGEDERSER